MDHIDDITLDSWSKDIVKMYFATIEELNEFRDKCQTVMDSAIYNHDHDRVSYIINFYDLYKTSSQPVIEAYRQYREEFPDENRPDCVGRALKLKKLLSEKLSQEYPDITKAIYVASNTFDYSNNTLEITKEMEDNYHHFVNFNEHCVVSLKFEISWRVGFIIFDMSFANTTAVIVMSDNQPPTRTVVKLANNRTAVYKCISENYVEIFYGQGGNVESINVFTIGLYVGAAFQRVDVSAKFCVQYNLEYKYVVRRGIMLTRVEFFQEDSFCRVRLWDHSKGKYDQTKIALEYFRQDTKDDHYEAIIDKVAQCLEEDKLKVREWMVKLSFIHHDQEFAEQLRALKFTLIEARKKYLNLM